MDWAAKRTVGCTNSRLVLHAKNCCWTLSLLCGGVFNCAQAQDIAQHSQASQVDKLPLTELPYTVRQALHQAKVPLTAMAAIVAPLESPPCHGGTQANTQPLRPILSVRAQNSLSVASLMKLFTTYAALDQLGPSWTWKTPVELRGPIENGVLKGTVVIYGRGDPSLVIERWWLLLKQIQDRGVQQIAGDIILDQQAFTQSGGAPSPADFDGEPLRPYNVLPRPLLVNFQTLSLSFIPSIDAGYAQLIVQPQLAGVQWPTQVRLSALSSSCGDWKSALQLDLTQANQPIFKGAFPAACGQRQWQLAWPDDARYASKVIAALWAQLGGKLQGQVTERYQSTDTSPLLSSQSARQTFEFVSPWLQQVVRDINKFSNNLMARQLFLTLGLLQGEGSLPHARQVVRQWAAKRIQCNEQELILDNGSGLSHTERATPACLARLLQSAWHSAVMAEFFASLPIVGQDGTTGNWRADQLARLGSQAHIKTGSLQDVAAMAGIVDNLSGRRYLVVGIINHAHAAAAHGALDALLNWSAQEAQK